MTSVAELLAQLRTYFDQVQQAFYLLGAILGLFGGIQVYLGYINGRKDVQKSLINLIIGLMILLATPTVLKTLL